MRKTMFIDEYTHNVMFVSGAGTLEISFRCKTSEAQYWRNEGYIVRMI